MKNVSFLALLTSISIIYAADTDPVILSHAIGGAGAVVNMGTGIDLGIIIGQPYALSNETLEDPNLPSLNGLQGFWMEVESVENTTPFNFKPSTAVPFMISASFGQQTAQVIFQLNTPAKANIRLLDLQGRNLIPAWSANLPSGTTIQNIKLDVSSSSAFFLVVETNQMVRTFHYTPNK